MLVRKLIAAAAMSLALAWSASAQTPPADQAPAPSGTAAPGTAAPATKKPAKKKAAPAKASKKKKGAPAAPPPKTDVDEETRKALESMTPAPAPAAPAAPAPAPVEEAAKGPIDDDPPVLTHTPVTNAKKGKSFSVSAHAVDPSGVFGPILYLRKKGLGPTEFIPMRMNASKTVPGDYALEIPAALTHVDALEYYIEAWDNKGNGPSRAGSPETPLSVKVEEEKKIVVAPPTEPVAPTNVVVKQKGAPPAISHSAVTQANKGQPIEINARLVGDTGVKDAIVLFRHVGEKEYKTLPMGNVGGDNWTATVPATMANADVEYYLEAFDKYGNGPGRSGAPNVPYVIKVSEPAPVEPPGPKIVRAPFSPNPGRSAGWLFMTGFVGGLIFAGGEAYASWTQNNAYTHTFQFEGRNNPDVLKAANASGDRAKTAILVAGGSLVAGVVLLIVFPAHPETIIVGGGGDVGVRF